METTVLALWLFLPAGVANMMPVFVRKLPFLDTPMDMGRTYWGKRLLGDNKTWRGLVSGAVGGVIMALIQHLTLPDIFSWSEAALFGLLLGLGALLGDAAESFFKRQKGLAPGRLWVPFDQIDWIVGALICSAALFGYGLIDVLAIFVVYGALHPIVNYIGFFLGLKNSRF